MRNPTRNEWLCGAIERIGDAAISYYPNFYGSGHYQVHARGRGFIGSSKNLKEARRIARDANLAPA